MPGVYFGWVYRSSLSICPVGGAAWGRSTNALPIRLVPPATLPPLAGIGPVLKGLAFTLQYPDCSLRPR